MFGSTKDKDWKYEFHMLFQAHMTLLRQYEELKARLNKVDAPPRSASPAASISERELDKAVLRVGETLDRQCDSFNECQRKQNEKASQTQNELDELRRKFFTHASFSESQHKGIASIEHNLQKQIDELKGASVSAINLELVNEILRRLRALESSDMRNRTATDDFQTTTKVVMQLLERFGLERVETPEVEKEFTLKAKSKV